MSNLSYNEDILLQNIKFLENKVIKNHHEN